MKPEVIFTKSAPKTGFSEGTESPIAQGVKVAGFLFVSGQGPLDPLTKTIVSDDIAVQTRVTLDNVRAVLEAGGTGMANVVRVGVYLRNMDDFPVFNRVFKEYFQGVQPARTTVEAAPPRKGVNVEIDAIAFCPCGPSRTPGPRRGVSSLQSGRAAIVIQFGLWHWGKLRARRGASALAARGVRGCTSRAARALATKYGEANWPSAAGFLTAPVADDRLQAR